MFRPSRSGISLVEVLVILAITIAGGEPFELD